MRRALTICSLLLAAAAPARGQVRPAPDRAPASKPEELRVVVARQIQQQTGIPVRIGALRYQIFSSSFVGREIEAGPRGRPLLRLPGLRVKLALLAGGHGVNLDSVEVKGAQLRVPASWLGRPLGRRNVQRISVRRVAVGATLVELVGAGRAWLKGVQLSVSGLVVPVVSARKPPRLRGRFTLRARSGQAWGVELSNVAVTGVLDGARIRITAASANLLGGQLRGKGTVSLGRRGLGKVDLKGQATLQLAPASRGPQHTGKVRLRGAGRGRMLLSGHLRGGPKLRPRRGGLGKGAPRVKLKLRLGRQRLRGTLSRWRLR